LDGHKKYLDSLNKDDKYYKKKLEAEDYGSPKLNYLKEEVSAV